MNDQWFQVPESDVEGEPDLPDVIDGYTGNSINDSPRWVVRVYADEETLDEIRNEPQATELTQESVEDAFSQVANVSTDDANRSFNVEVNNGT